MTSVVVIIIDREIDCSSNNLSIYLWRVICVLLSIDPMHDSHRKPKFTRSFVPCCIKQGTALFVFLVIHTYTYPLHILSGLVSKEVIRPQVPLRPPCYDFSLVADPRFDSANEAPPRQEPTSMKRRAVCARSRDVFTARL